MFMDCYDVQLSPSLEPTSVLSKNSSFFPDLSAARQKAHRR